MSRKQKNKLTEAEVERIAKLARLGITDEEKEKFGRELSAILEYIEELNRVGTEGVLPMAGGTELANVMREDEPRKIDLISEPSLVDQAPESKDGFVKVPRILE
jgi:aspartyl-tRNA(Asn)/glutamyl-tRNA(Gln) amidotransferase subunit C